VLAFKVTAGALRPGLASDSSTGGLSGSPASAGTFSGSVTASNGFSGPDAVQSVGMTEWFGPHLVEFVDHGGRMARAPLKAASTVLRASRKPRLSGAFRSRGAEIRTRDL